MSLYFIMLKIWLIFNIHIAPLYKYINKSYIVLNHKNILEENRIFLNKNQNYSFEESRFDIKKHFILRAISNRETHVPNCINKSKAQNDQKQNRRTHTHEIKGKREIVTEEKSKGWGAEWAMKRRPQFEPTHTEDVHMYGKIYSRKLCGDPNIL